MQYEDEDMVSVVDLKNSFRFMSDKEIQACRNYLGEEIAFFFLFARYLCQFLVVPAALGFLFRFYITFFADQYDDEHVDKLRLAFGVFMTFWGSLFVGFYRREEARWILRWGMKDVQTHQETLKTYEPDWDNSWKVLAIKALTPLLVTGMIFLILAGVQTITNLRSQWHLEGRYFIGGLIRGEDFGGFLITGQILFFDFIWKQIAKKLAEIENHRTVAFQETSRVMKVFFVKLVNTFLPFMFTAFVKRHYEPCGMDHDNAESCLPELQADLSKYFGVYIFLELGKIVAYNGLTRWKVTSELQHAKAEAKSNGEKEPVATYLDVQGKSFNPPPIANEYMELMTGFALICYFGQVLPILSFLYFISNMVEVRLVAYRYARVTQRARPYRAEGIGPWLFIFEFITYIAIIVVPALSVFELHPLRDYPEVSEFQMFLILEHVFLILNFFTHYCFHEVPYDVQEALKFQDSLKDYLFSGKHIAAIVLNKEKWSEVEENERTKAAKAARESGGDQVCRNGEYPPEIKFQEEDSETRDRRLKIISESSKPVFRTTSMGTELKATTE
jgi:hypothetical protein